MPPRFENGFVQGCTVLPQTTRIRPEKFFRYKSKWIYHHLHNQYIDREFAFFMSAPNTIINQPGKLVFIPPNPVAEHVNYCQIQTTNIFALPRSSARVVLFPSKNCGVIGPCPGNVALYLLMPKIVKICSINSPRSACNMVWERIVPWLSYFDIYLFLWPQTDSAASKTISFFSCFEINSVFLKLFEA